MQALDEKTLSLVGLITSLMLPLVLMAVGQLTRQDPATRSWSLGATLYALGFLGLALRNAIPDLLSIPVANLLLMFGYAELLHGCRYFFGRSVRRAWVLWLAVPYGIVMFMSMSGAAAQERRIFVSSLVLMVIAAAIAKEFVLAARLVRVTHHAGAQAERRILAVIGGVFLVTGVMFGARALAYSGVEALAPYVVGIKAVYAYSFLIGILVNFLLASCLPLLVSRRTQRELHASETSLVHAQNLAGLGTAVIDVETRKVTANALLHNMLEVPMGAPMTMDRWTSVVHPEDQTRMRSALQALLSGSITQSANEYRIVHPADGKTRWISGVSELHTDPVDKKRRVLATLRDITALKESELAAVRASEAAELANSAKSSFLANMSHEIRTPMNGIIGLTQLVLKGPLQEDQRELVAKAHDSAQSLLGIINDILDFSKIEAGKLTVESIPFDLRRPLVQLENMFASFASSKGIAFELQVDANVPRGLVGDPLRLSQILNNLVGNAVKFTEKGSVHLLVRRVDDAAQGGTQARLEFAVRDTGIGISEQQQARLFQPFSQADDSTTRKFGGTGLGLTISRKLVDLLGGTLALESVAQQGSVFTVTLPFGLSDESLTERRAEPRAPVASIVGLRALLVEDNPINIMVAKMLLQSRGVVVTVAENGQLAVDALLGHPTAFDVVLMDVQMPVMDGREATRRIRQDTRFASLPIIAMTADAMAEDRQRCLDAGMTDYISKPIDSERLYALLARWAQPA